MFTEILAEMLGDADIENVESTPTSLTADNISVTTETSDDHEKVDVAIEHPDGQWNGSFQIPLNDQDSEEALSQVILDQLNYWSGN